MTIRETLRLDLDKKQRQLDEALREYDDKVTNDGYEQILKLQAEVKKAKKELAKWL